MELLRRKGVWTWAGELVPWAISAYCRVGRFDDAAALVAELEAALDGMDAPLSRAAVHASHGELATAQEEIPVALSHFRQAKQQFDRLPQPYLSGLTAERIVTGQLALGDHAAADQLADLADAFDKLGATRDAARCRHLSRSSGAIQHSRRGRRGYGNDLSPRERDVARLVAGGATNRGIAEVLFLSRRTVEQHVANVLRKLNLPSRTALTEPPGT